MIASHKSTLLEAALEDQLGLPRSPAAKPNAEHCPASRDGRRLCSKARWLISTVNRSLGRVSRIM